MNEPSSTLPTAESAQGAQGAQTLGRETNEQGSITTQRQEAQTHGRTHRDTHTHTQTHRETSGAQRGLGR